MATSFTSNLGLRLSTNFTDDLLFNFRKLDELATVYQTERDGTVTIRSLSDITIEPNSSDLGATADGGTVNFGSPSSPLTSVAINAAAVDFQNADISGLAGLSSITDANIDAAAAIAGSKINPDFGAQVIKTSDSLQFVETYLTSLRAAQSGQTANITLTLPPNPGTSGQVLSTDGAGNLSFITVAGGAGSTSKAVFAWTAGDTDTKVFTHNLNTRDVVIQVYDSAYKTVELDDEERTSVNTATLTRSGPGAGSWTVVIIG